MHIAHSNIGKPAVKATPKPAPVNRRAKSAKEWSSSYYQMEYNKLCKKYAAEIQEIQRVFPGWTPPRFWLGEKSAFKNKNIK